jgi:hypothetical protein
VNTQARQQPTTNESADNADSNIGNKAKACALNDLASEPTRDKADQQDNE